MSVELVATSIADRTYERLRADIIFGRLEPSRRLRLDRLARDYGASISTLRETLSRLSSEGLVLAEGQRGFQVAPVSGADFREIASMRLLLEKHALELSFVRGDIEWESEVVAAHYKLSTMERRIFAGERDATVLWKRYDREFHRALIGACGSQLLLDTYATIYDQYLRYQIVAVVFRGEAAANEHKLLLDHALSRDAQRACAVLVQHVDDCVTHTLKSGTLS